MQNLQSVNYAKFASYKQCKPCKLQTMQNLQVVNNAQNASYKQLTQQHSITMPLFQVDLIYGPSTDRIDRPAIQSPWHLVPVTAPRGQTGSTCRTLRILQYLARPLPVRSRACTIRRPPGAVVPVVCPIAKPFQCIFSIS